MTVQTCASTLIRVEMVSTTGKELASDDTQVFAKKRMNSCKT